MTKTDLIAQVAANTEMSKKSAEQAVSAVFEALGKAMTEGEKITISGFGTFEVRERAERQGINPRTREPITIAASRSIVFKPGKSFGNRPIKVRVLSDVEPRTKDVAREMYEVIAE